MSGNELYSKRGGKKEDADEHNPILEEGDAPLAFVSTYLMLVRSGWTEKQIADQYGSVYQTARARALI